MANAIRKGLAAHATGMNQIEAKCKDLEAIYLAARNSIEYRLRHFADDRRNSLTGPKLALLLDELREEFSGFENSYSEKLKYALEYVANRNYSDAMIALGLKGNKSVIGGLNKQRLQLMVDDAFTHVAGATQNMRDVAINNLRKISAAVMREAAMTGESRAVVSRRLLLANNTDGMFRFIDKAGRTWDSRNYFRMLGRTVLLNNARESYLQACADEKSDIVRISVSGKCCPACSKYENRILSISGKTPGIPTLDEAMAEGLFHPNCTHRMVAVPPSIAKAKYGIDVPPQKTSVAAKQQADNPNPQSHREIRESQLKTAYEHRISTWRKSMEEAGISQSVSDELADAYTLGMSKIGKPPKIVTASNKAFYSPRKNELYLDADASSWSGHPLTARHEFGHWVDFHTRFRDYRKFKTIDEAHAAAADFNNAAQADWKALKKKSNGNLKIYNEQTYISQFDPPEGTYWEELSKTMFGKEKSELELSERKILRQYQDTVGSISNGNYGGGHSKQYYKKSQWGNEEAFAQAYSAYCRKDQQFKLEFPNITAYIENIMKGIEK